MWWRIFTRRIFSLRLEYDEIRTNFDKTFIWWYTSKSRKPFWPPKRLEVFHFFTEHRKPLYSKAFSRSNRRYTEQSTGRGWSKSRKIAEVFQFTHLGPVTPRAQGHRVVALLIPSSVLKPSAKKTTDTFLPKVVALLIPSSVLKHIEHDSINLWVYWL